jgi:hypothetical protein
VAEPLPLAAASARLRGKPGRPRKAAGDPVAQIAVNALGLPPRLLDVAGAASYLGGVSPWTIRDLIATGRLARVRLPLAGDREIRRVLLDVRDLDKLIDTSKERPA